MGIINIIKSVKFVHPSCVVMVKIGNFYHIYGKDAYIFSYLLNYKINLKEDIPHCGFPINSISKVENVLEKNKINYVLLDRRNNYDEEAKYINKQENKHEKIFERAKKSVNIVMKIQKINQFLIENKKSKNIDDLLEKIEKVIGNERGKI